ncbi:hypothetical protein [Moorella stamsii (nom. illeg.)]|uniref:DUF4185 domain-containing protein n=1 Tax=Neomoorella stamsii TaxID=1266720 RepID=A0A9X7P758_9FIRM|nr:hypothetical protein [Moorella stamsii]PRR76284.1 hypothetical protein MOST_04450 [Moorella stamsii]
MCRKLVAVLLLAAMLLMLPLDAWANYPFKDKNFHQPPPGYDNLTYTRTQGAYIDFKLVDPFSVASGNPEGGFCVDFGPTAPYRSTAEYLFAPDHRDARGNLILGDGWGFINPYDRLTPPPNDLATWLDMLEWPKSGGWYNVTDAGAMQGSNAIRNIYYHMPYGTRIVTSPHATGASKTDPILISPGPNYDTINDGQRDIRAADVFPNGQAVYLFNLTKDAAIGLVHRLDTLYPNMGVYYVPEVGYEHKKVAFTADLAVTQLTGGIPGSNDMAPYAAVIENMAPFEAYNALFELYVWPEGDPALTRVASEPVNLPRGSVSTGTPGAVTLAGYFAVPAGRSYKLIAAINARYDAGGSVLGANPGRWAKQPYSPVYNGSVPPGTGAFFEPYYDNNVKSVGFVRALPPPDDGGGSGGEPPVQPGNLAVTRVEYDGSRITGYFRSTFTAPGKVNIRFYKQSRAGSIAYIAGLTNYPVKPNSDFVESVPAFNLGNDIIIASIDYYYSGGIWHEEDYRQDDGKTLEETTYLDNKASTGRVEDPPGPPKKAVTYDIAKGWYWPVYWVKTPRYHTETRRVWRDKWVQVPVYFDTSKPKIKVRLIE